MYTVRMLQKTLETKQTLRFKKKKEKKKKRALIFAIWTLDQHLMYAGLRCHLSSSGRMGPQIVVHSRTLMGS
jgi:hypothetical protein